MESKITVNKEVHLFEFAKSYSGLVITPMLPSFVPIEDTATAFDPHRHDSYGLFLLKSGEMTMSVEENEVIMRNSSLLLVQPGQVHQCIRSLNIDGWVMFFDGKNLDTKARSINEQSVVEILLFELNPDELLITEQLLQSIFQAFENKTPGPMQTQIMHSLTNALFYHATNINLLRKSTTKNYASRPAQIVHEFKALTKSNFKSLKKPGDYATLMHISVSHLNDTIKANTGYSSTHFIQQEVIGEAQRQLRYSSKLIKEIASDLGFSDHKYFIRLFSKAVGQSPAVFRNTITTSQVQIQNSFLSKAPSK
jgi:AraC family transcriptional activator of pobA